MPHSFASRPDPDAILARVNRDQARQARGRLRIYFGASAGVGKTYAMLVAARSQKEEGRDVVIGVIETHGRSETAALLARGGFETLLQKRVEYREHVLFEFDIDGALLRKPELLLVDELAHSNVAGSRHPKRWQDVEELLAAGIDVYTALNVQHLESLNEVVGAITEVRVFETVPDTFFDSADEVILVDLPAEELQKRLAEGKVYQADQAVRAGKGFFRRGNLMALRELALRRTADRIEEDVQSYRADRSILPVWKTEAALLCAIGPDPGSENSVRATARLASQSSCNWHAVYVETPRLQRLPESERERILATVHLAEELGASTAILSATDIGVRLVTYARSHNLSRVILGRRRPRKLWPWRTPLSMQIAHEAPEIDLVELGFAPANTSAPLRAGNAPIDEPSPKAARRRYEYGAAALACVATTLLTLPLLPMVHLTNIAMLFLLTVALVAMFCGRGPAALSAVLNVAAYDFFFVPPRFSFAVSDIQYVLTFGVMLAVGLIIGELTARLRVQVRVATQRQERSQNLFEFARELSRALRVEDVIALGGAELGRAFRAEVHLLASNDPAHLEIAAAIERTPEFEPAIARWAFDRGEPAGLGTDTLPGSRWIYLPIKAASRVRGVMAMKPKSRRILRVPEQMRQLETFVALVAIALERVHYVAVAQDALVGIESERLRNSLLSALSHDLRTPLAVLSGLSDSLLLTRPELSGQQAELSHAIHDEAMRMNALVTNLLDMARIESGDIRMNLQWQPIEEVVGSALASMKTTLAGHEIKLAIDEGLPLVQFDAMLIERVLVNLIENATKYAGEHATITISATQSEREVIVAIEDDGPGLPRGREEALFEKFVRGQVESNRPGVGLGLAICRAIVHAHGGRIEAEQERARGARFLFTLPKGQPPSVIDETPDPAGYV